MASSLGGVPGCEGCKLACRAAHGSRTHGCGREDLSGDTSFEPAFDTGLNFLY